MKSIVSGLLLSVSSLPALALQPLSDAVLSDATGQDGMTIAVSLPSATLAFSELAFRDQDGICLQLNGACGAGGALHLGLDYRSSAALVYGPATAGAGLRLFTSPTQNTATAAPILIKVDAGSGATGATLNMEVSLPSDLVRINLSPFSVYASGIAGAVFSPTRTLNAGVTEVLRVGAQGKGIDIIFVAGNAPKFNFQLGAEPQAHMMLVTGGKLLRMGTPLDGSDPLQLMSKNGTPSSLTLDFNLAATDQAAGFSLNGFKADMASDGLYLAAPAVTDKLDMTIGNVVAGTVGAQSAAAFNNLKNATMGSVGAVGMTVTGLEVKVSGF
jgi:hypothetical protein